MQLQLRILDLENWRKNSEIKEFENQFEKFLMEWGLQRRTTTRVAYEGRDCRTFPTPLELQVMV